MGRKAFLFFLSIFLFQNVKADEKSEVTIPLDDYQKLIDKQKDSPLTVLEEVKLSGDLKTNRINISLKGRASRPWVAIGVMDAFDGAVKNCSGEALIFKENSEFMIKPLSEKFSLRCDLAPKSKNFSMTIENALYFESLVVGADSSVSEEGPLNRRVALSERSPQINTRIVPVIAKANYKLTILPDNSKFYYQFQISNLNRTLRQFEIPWVNSEFVEQVQTNLKYIENKDNIELTVPSGEHTVIVTGKLTQTEFKPLLASEEQYLLIQSHPLIQVQPKTNWRRIASSESPIGQEFNSARTFLIDPKSALVWDTKKLQVFSSLGYSIKDASYLYYVGKDAQVWVEASYRISNQGTPEIPLAVPGKALYIEIDGSPMPLYKDEKNNLLVTMSSGDHRLVVQYQPQATERRLASFEHESLLKPQVVTSGATLVLRHDSSWRLMAGSFADRMKSYFSSDDILWALIVFGLYVFLLKKHYKISNSKTVYALTAFVLLLSLVGSYYTESFFFIGIALFVWPYRKHIVNYFQTTSGWMGKVFRMALAGILLLLVIVSLGVSFVKTKTRFNHTSDKLVGSLDSAGAYSAAPPPPMTANTMKGESYDLEEGDASLSGGRAFGAAPGLAQNADTHYEGLPAKIEIPHTGQQYVFQTQLVDAEKPLNLNAFFVKDYLFLILDSLLLAGLAWVLYRNRVMLKIAFLKA